MDDKVKNLLERVRGTASYAADAAADGARAAGKRAGQMVDVAKLNVQLFDLNGEYNDLLRQLGQVMYDTHRGGPGERRGDQITGPGGREGGADCRAEKPHRRFEAGRLLPCLRRALRPGRQVLPGLR